MRASRAPGTLDVMGGVAEYTGSILCRLPLQAAVAVGTQGREDRDVQVFSFNRLEENKPFTVQVPLEAMSFDALTLRREFADPGRTWAAYLVGGLALLCQRGLLGDDAKGANVAVWSDVPAGAGLGSSAAVGVAALLNLLDHYQLRSHFTPIALATMVRDVESQLVGRSGGICQPITSCSGVAGAMLRMRGEPLEWLNPLPVPKGMKFVAIDSGVRSGGKETQRLRCAAFMAQRMILEKMRDFGRAAGRPLERDPTGGYLANLDPDDYKKLFRQFLPESMKGGEFLVRFGGTSDAETNVSPDVFYKVLGAADHHVLDAMRARNFIEQVEEAVGMDAGDPARGLVLDKAGHLMYASHLSYMNDAGLGSAECDLLVSLVRKRERNGLYGARMTAGGCGGTVAVLCEDNEKADAAIREIAGEYQKKTGKTPGVFEGGSSGAWESGTEIVAL